MRRAWLLFLVVLGACSGPAPYTLHENANGQNVEILAGQELRFELDHDPKTGARWQWSDSSGSIVQLVEPPKFVAASAFGPGKQTWRFRAREAGSGSLLLEYRRPFAEHAAKTVQIQINSN